MLCFIFKTSTKLHHIQIKIYERRENLLFHSCNVHKLKQSAMERKRGNFLLVKKLAERETNELLSKILGKDKEKYVLNEGA